MTATILDPAYQLFVGLLKSPETKKRYSICISNFAKWQNISSLDELLVGDIKSQKNTVIQYLLELKKQGLSSSTRNTVLAAIKHYYSINDVVLNWRIISKSIGERKTSGDRPYTREEIAKLLSIADLKLRAMILLPESSGIRFGVLPDLKYGDLEKMPGHDIYKITVYREDEDNEYYTFCTPECYKAINEYLESRRRLGEVITAKSPLFRVDPNPSIMDGVNKDGVKIGVLNPEAMSYDGIKSRFRKLVREAGVAVYEKLSATNTKGKRRNVVKVSHGLRKYFATVLEDSDVSDFHQEGLLGHREGLRGVYRKNHKKRFAEYLKAVDNLTINEENRLKSKVEVLEEKNQQIAALQKQVDEISQSRQKMVLEESAAVQRGEAALQRSEQANKNLFQSMKLLMERLKEHGIDTTVVDKVIDDEGITTESH